MNNETTANLLWTGGWDSTYRFLDLVLHRRRVVQPFYILDEDRLSTGVEIRTMKNIKKAVIRKHPDAADLILPTIFRELHEIKPDPEISDALQVVRQNGIPIGSQYDWLARFAKEMELNHLEIGVERGGFAEKVVEGLKVAEQVDGDRYYCMHSRDGDLPEYRVFKYFRFPILDYFKHDLLRLSDEHGFTDFMNMTWFCHRPRNHKVPCGTCNPCIFTIEDGLAYRLPLSSRLRYHFSVKRRIARFLRNHRKVHENLRRVKRRVLRTVS